METIKILLADDHRMIRDGIRFMLRNEERIEIVAEANDGIEVLQYLKKNPNTIDVLLLDINMPEKNGIETAEEIYELKIPVKILALTMHTEESYIVKMVKAGALGYILKESGKEELIKAIKQVNKGKKYFSNEVSVTMINSIVNGTSENYATQFGLTKRELSILAEIAEGLTNKEIGEKLFISGRTVETHRRNILKKLKVKNTAEMVRFAIKEGIIE